MPGHSPLIIYDWRVAKKSPLPDRFADGLNPNWQGGIHGESWWRECTDRILETKDAVPSLLHFPAPPPGPAPKRPIAFVSHRQADRVLAKEAALLAQESGFDVWVDVLDPTLKGFSAESPEPVWIARIIDMALVNATHVVVVRTPHTDPQTWVPYTYGRMRDSATVGDRAACWVVNEPDAVLPAYYYLGHVAESRKALAAWLSSEGDKWGTAPPAPPSIRGTSRSWRGTPSPGLPNPPHSSHGEARGARVPLDRK